MIFRLMREREEQVHVSVTTTSDLPSGQPSFFLSIFVAPVSVRVNFLATIQSQWVVESRENRCPGQQTQTTTIPAEREWNWKRASTINSRIGCEFTGKFMRVLIRVPLHSRGCCWSTCRHLWRAAGWLSIWIGYYVRALLWKRRLLLLATRVLS